jgi:hypothetical protein
MDNGPIVSPWSLVPKDFGLGPASLRKAKPRVKARDTFYPTVQPNIGKHCHSEAPSHQLWPERAVSAGCGSNKRAEATKEERTASALGMLIRLIYGRCL